MLEDSFSLYSRIVSVLVPIPAECSYSYLVVKGMEVIPGSIVRVPLGSREVVGIVTDNQPNTIDVRKLRSISRVFDCPPIKLSMMHFIKWVADYTLSPLGMVVRMMLRAPAAFDPEPLVSGLRYSGFMPTRMTKARSQLIKYIRDKPLWTRAELTHATGISLAVIDGLKTQGVFEEIMIQPPPVVTLPDIDYAPIDLSPSQKIAADTLLEAVSGNGFSVALLDGVTGSGKTEVYFEAVAKIIETGKQILILFPEIALTQQFLDRFQDRFGAKPAEWHSNLAPRMRERVWRQIAEGRVKVVVGARSALFLPFHDLGLIIVDEEHDPAYKQEDRVFYNARDMAVVRGHIGNFPIVLASATPSIESQSNAKQGRYKRIKLAARYAEAAMPSLKAIDMRRSPPLPGRFLSPILTDAIKKALQRKEQSLLFLNRRGYAPLTLCCICGHRFQCFCCSSWLVEHRVRNQLMCHQCGYHEPTPQACPTCGALDHLVAYGPGVERIAEEVMTIFPDARMILLSSDLMGDIKRLRCELETIAKGEVDIVIGTQLAAKGHNFPNMTLVGVIDADLGLANGDPRAAERTFQLLRQVTGRAGRTGRKSFGLIQTYQPDHPVMRAIISNDAETFYACEIEERKRSGLPPFGQLAALIVSADTRAEAENHARALRRVAPSSSEISVLGPAEAPLALIRGRFRFRLLIHGTKRADIQTFIRSMLIAGPKERGSIRTQIDIDPQSFL